MTVSGAAACGNDNNGQSGTAGAAGVNMQLAGQTSESTAGTEQGGTEQGGTEQGGTEQGGTEQAGNAVQGGAMNGANAGQGGEGGVADLSTLSDAQILLVLDTLNAGEVAEAQAAMPHLSNADVVAFAKRMVSDHTDARKMVESTETKLKLSPASSAVEQTLKDESQQHVAHFGMAGDMLDADYLGTELAGHAQALELLTSLEQTADAAALKDLIATLKTTVQSHYDSAKQIQMSL